MGLLRLLAFGGGVGFHPWWLWLFHPWPYFCSLLHCAPTVTPVKWGPVQSIPQAAWPGAPVSYRGFSNKALYLSSKEVGHEPREAEPEGCNQHTLKLFSTLLCSLNSYFSSEHKSCCPSYLPALSTLLCLSCK